MISIEIDGIAAARARLSAIGGRARNLQPVLAGRAAAFQSMIVTEVFGRSQSPSGEQWQALQAPRKRGSNLHATPLVDTGQLRQSVFATATDDSIIFGSSGAASEYAGFHQSGTRFIPQRQFLPTSEADFASGPAASWKERLRERITRYIVDGSL